MHNTRKDKALKKLSRSLDLIISTINAPLDVSAFLDTLAPKGSFHNVGAVLKPLEVPAFGLILGQKLVAGSPTGSPTAIHRMLEFSARHSVAPVVEYFPMSNVTMHWNAFARARPAIASSSLMTSTSLRPGLSHSRRNNPRLRLRHEAGRQNCLPGIAYEHTSRDLRTD